MSHNWLGWSAGEHNICLYADDGRIAGQDPFWVQTAQIKMVRVFKNVGLQTNLGKIKAMTFTLGFIWVQQRVVAYKRRAPGEGDTFGERKRTRVICTECGGTMAASSLRYHMEISHGIILPQIRSLDFAGGGSETYMVPFPHI